MLWSKETLSDDPHSRPSAKVLEMADVRVNAHAGRITHRQRVLMPAYKVTWRAHVSAMFCTKASRPLTRLWDDANVAMIPYIHTFTNRTVDNGLMNWLRRPQWERGFIRLLYVPTLAESPTSDTIRGNASTANPTRGQRAPMS